MLQGSSEGAHVALSLVEEDKSTRLEAHIQDILGTCHIGQPCCDVVCQVITACSRMRYRHEEIPFLSGQGAQLSFSLAHEGTLAALRMGPV